MDFNWQCVNTIYFQFHELVFEHGGKILKCILGP